MTLIELVKLNKNIDTVIIETSTTVYGQSFTTNLGRYDVNHRKYNGTGVLSNEPKYICAIEMTKIPQDVEVNYWSMQNTNILEVNIKVV